MSKSRKAALHTIVKQQNARKRLKTEISSSVERHGTVEQPIPEMNTPTRLDILYNGLPECVRRGPLLPTLQLEKGSSRKFIEDLIMNVLEEEQEQEQDAQQRKKENIIEMKLRDKCINLDNVRSSTRKRKKHTKPRHLRAKERKSMNIFQIPLEKIRYSLYRPLHLLWKQYIEDLLRGIKEITAQEAKMIKADFHGAIIKVTRSKCPSLIGINGLIVKETENTFVIITRNDTMKVIPKSNNVFTIQINEHIITLYGNHFRYRSYERAARKFKSKSTIEL